jgi:hypothetical protein
VSYTVERGEKIMANGLEDCNSSPLERTIYMDRLTEPRKNMTRGPIIQPILDEIPL